MKKLLLIIIIILLIFTYTIKKNDDLTVISRNMYFTQYKSQLIIMTYNINHGLGIDNKLDIDRIASVIAASGADIVGLNEVDNRMLRSGFRNQVKLVADKLGMNYIFGSAMNLGIGNYGNAILSKFPIKEVKNYRLPGKIGLEPRALLETKIEINENTYLYIMTTHLSLNHEERIKQIEWIENYLINIKDPFLIMGDFNMELEELQKYKSLISNIKTYPSQEADESIDQIYSNYNCKIKGYSILTNASDHLPVILEIDLPV
jgi:endonuclease/exonuclease/phosphatase family metal-dependent hydrolase